MEVALQRVRSGSTLTGHGHPELERFAFNYRKLDKKAWKEDGSGTLQVLVPARGPGARGPCEHARRARPRRPRAPAAPPERQRVRCYPPHAVCTGGVAWRCQMR
jgi:hypothetical protein